MAKTLAALEIAKGIEVDHVFLHGSAARQARRRRRFSGRDILHPPPSLGDWPQTFPSDRAAARDLAGAFALAKACSSAEPVNFRRGDLAYTAGLPKTQQKAPPYHVPGRAVVFLLCVEVGLRYYLVTRDLNSLNNSIRSIYREVFPTRKKAVDEVAELRSEIKRLGGGRDASILPILKKLAESKGDDITGIYEAEIEGDQVRLKGDARSVQAVNDFKTRAAAAFTGAEVGEIKSRPDGSVTFTFRATVKEGEK